MAKVLLAHSSFEVNGQIVVPAFFEGLINALVRQGNQVLHVVTNDFVFSPWQSSEISADINKEKLVADIQAFGPDLILSANNVLSAAILAVTDCPIAVWTMDSPLFYPDTLDIKPFAERYYFFCASAEIILAARRVYPSIAEDRFVELPFATDLHAQDIAQDKNINFIGTNWSASFPLKAAFQKAVTQSDIADDWDRFVEEVIAHPYLTTGEIYDRLGFSDQVFPHIRETDILNLVAGNRRLQTLAAITKVPDFHLYGTTNWINSLDFSYDIFKCYRPDAIYDIADTERLYNSSRISLSIAHPQTTDALPWRVCDIMATNSVLISDERKNINKFFPALGIPTYKSPQDGYELCMKLLASPEERHDISARCQEAIAQGHRFEHRFAVIARETGVDLLATQGQGGCSRIAPERYYNERQKIKHGFSFVFNKLALLGLPIAFKVAKTMKFKPSDELRNRLRDII